jgi:hypothetical protein
MASDACLGQNKRRTCLHRVRCIHIEMWRCHLCTDKDTYVALTLRRMAPFRSRDGTRLMRPRRTARSARLRKKNFACAPSRPPSSTANGARLCLPRGSSQLVQHSTVRGSTWYGSVWYIVARYDTVRHYTVRYGDIWITKDNVIEKFIRPFELSKDCIKIKVPSVMIRIGE